MAHRLVVCGEPTESELSVLLQGTRTQYVALDISMIVFYRGRYVISVLGSEREKGRFSGYHNKLVLVHSVEYGK